MTHILYIVLLIAAVMLSYGIPARCELPEDIEGNDIIFVYVHGFGEFKHVVPYFDTFLTAWNDSVVSYI